jgi:hypothetical protein
MWFAEDTDTDMKQAVTSSLLTSDTDFLYSEIQSLVQCGTYADMSMVTKWRSEV